MYMYYTCFWCVLYQPSYWRGVTHTCTYTCIYYNLPLEHVSPSSLISELLLPSLTGSASLPLPLSSSSSVSLAPVSSLSKPTEQLRRALFATPSPPPGDNILFVPTTCCVSGISSSVCSVSVLLSAALSDALWRDLNEDVVSSAYKQEQWALHVPTCMNTLKWSIHVS